MWLGGCSGRMGSTGLLLCVCVPTPHGCCALLLPAAEAEKRAGSQAAAAVAGHRARGSGGERPAAMRWAAAHGLAPGGHPTRAPSYLRAGPAGGPRPAGQLASYCVRKYLSVDYGLKQWACLRHALPTPSGSRPLCTSPVHRRS